MYLAELALDIARQTLEIGGCLVVKLFHGEGFDDVVRDVRRDFGGVRVRKPAASRARSRETYLTAKDYGL
jgi:23S rRNA (uridine2552-2'-O)-methyltransferase